MLHHIILLEESRTSPPTRSSLDFFMKKEKCKKNVHVFYSPPGLKIWRELSEDNICEAVSDPTHKLSLKTRFVKVWIIQLLKPTSGYHTLSRWQWLTCLFLYLPLGSGMISGASCTARRTSSQMSEVGRKSGDGYPSVGIFCRNGFSLCTGGNVSHYDRTYPELGQSFSLSYTR